MPTSSVIFNVRFLSIQKTGSKNLYQMLCEKRNEVYNVSLRLVLKGANIVGIHVFFEKTQNSWYLLRTLGIAIVLRIV